MAIRMVSTSPRTAKPGRKLFNRGHYFIPYYFGKPRTGTFHFNEAGILTDFEYNQEN